MPRYSAERKAALLKKLLPPINLSVAEVARQILVLRKKLNAYWGNDSEDN